MSMKEDAMVARASKVLKIGGGLLFLALNGLLIYHFATAYDDGQKRGEILHKEKEERKKSK